MSSYAALKEMALKKKEEEQAALNRERERKEKEAAAKLAAREAAEREQKQRERKILVQRMARQKEEEARERLRKEQAVQLNQDRIADDEAMNEAKAIALKQGLANSSKPKSNKPSGSTHKVDLSDRLKGSSSSARSGRGKRKMDEDDFVGNRFDKPAKAKTERTASSSSATKRKAVPMTREEKQAIKRAREFGGIPKLPPISRLHVGSGSSRSSPNVSAGEADSRLSARGQLAKQNGLVALGTKKRDHRSIVEIERDLKRIKEQQGLGKTDGPSQAELEREAALARRQKAMEEKRRKDQEARERASLKKTSENEDEDLFGSASDDEPASSRKLAPQRSSKSSEGELGGNDQPYGFTKARPLSNTQPREPRPIAIRLPGGINPADFLPGAPLRPEAMARLAQKGKDSSLARRSPDSDTRVRTKRASEIRSSPANTASPAPAAPPKRETARDRFIREQEEKKKAAAASSSGKSSGRQDDEYDSEEEGFEDEYGSDGYDDEDDNGGGGHNYRDEIWKMFGKDRKKYASRVVDSDDDMEADAASVLQEELRSSRQAREEDLREEQLEKQREREKMLRKQASNKAGR